MHATQIVKKPLITEKGTWQMNARNRYCFEVDLHANKQQIRDAIVAIYKVRVASVATQVRKEAQRKTRWGVHPGQIWKKATVELHPDDKIDLF